MRVRAEGDVGLGADHAGHPVDLLGDDGGEVVVVGDPDHRDQVERAGDGVHLADALDRRHLLGDLRNPRDVGLDEHDRGDHAVLSSNTLQPAEA